MAECRTVDRKVVRKSERLGGREGIAKHPRKRVTGGLIGPVLLPFNYSGGCHAIQVNPVYALRPGLVATVTVVVFGVIALHAEGFTDHRAKAVLVVQESAEAEMDASNVRKLVVWNASGPSAYAELGIKDISLPEPGGEFDPRKV